MSDTGASGAASVKKSNLESALDEMSSHSLVEEMEGLETLLVYSKNLILFPDEKKYRKVKLNNVHYNERLGHLTGSRAAMAAIGYALSGDYLRLDEQKSKDEGNEETLRELEGVLTNRLNAVKRQFNALPKRTPHEHEFSSVRGVAAHSEIGKRQSMEDDEIYLDSFCGDATQGFFGLYDGHGGRATVDFITKVLHMNLESYLTSTPDASILEAFKVSYLATDAQLRRQNILRSGSTSVTCIVRKEDRAKRLYVANVGDSRAVLVRGGKGIRLTIDHKASLPEEAKRITEAGGFVGRNKRVNGVLAISRALGDHMLKENDVVTARPYCTDIELEKEDTHIILACDGVWDVMTDQEATEFVLARREKILAGQDGAPTPGAGLNSVLQQCAKALVQEALDRRSLDNITVMIVEL